MNEVLKTIGGLRSIRNFSARQVSDGDFETIIDACVHAANASARQSYSIIAISDKEAIREDFAFPADKALLFCVDVNRLELTAKHVGKEYANKGVHSFLAGSTDTILAAQTAAIAAKSMGIDSVFRNNMHRSNLRRLYKNFNLPTHMCFPWVVLLLGYPEAEPEFKKGRLTGKGIIHREQYQLPDEQALDEITETYDDKVRHLGSIDNWESEGFRHYLEWFYEQQGADGNLIDVQRELFAVLREAGFFDPEILL